MSCWLANPLLLSKAERSWQWLIVAWIHPNFPEKNRYKYLGSIPFAAISKTIQALCGSLPICAINWLQASINFDSWKNSLLLQHLHKWNSCSRWLEQRLIKHDGATYVLPPKRKKKRPKRCYTDVNEFQ